MLKQLRNWVSHALASQPAAGDLRDNQPPAPFTFDVVRGQVAVTVYENEFDALEGPVPCWAFVTHGLARTVQTEVVLFVERQSVPLEDCARAARGLFEQLHRAALEGRVGLGGIVEIPAVTGGLLGDTRFSGIAFIPSEPLLDIPLPPASLTVLVLTRNELEAAKTYGLVRLMGLLGSRYRRFPTAPWVVRERPDVASKEEMASSVLSRTGWMRLSNCRAYLRGIETRREALAPTGSLDNDRVSFARQEVVLEVAAREAEGMSRILAERGQNQVVAVLLCPDPGADAALVWVRGSRDMNAISVQGGTGTRIAGNHVIFIPEQGRDQVNVVEDGFALLLTNSTWLEIRDLLAHGPQNWGMPVSDGIGFRLKVGMPDP